MTPTLTFSCPGRRAGVTARKLRLYCNTFVVIGWPVKTVPRTDGTSSKRSAIVLELQVVLQNE